MARRSRKNRVLAGQISLDLRFFDRATIHAAAEEVVDKEVSEAALEVAVDSLKLPKRKPDKSYDLSIHDTDKKMILNRLGESTKKLIYEAVPHSKKVQKFISDRAKQTNDPDFPDKLRSCFVAEYKRLIQDEGLVGDELFGAIRQAISDRIESGAAKFAAQAILVHLFIICEIFMRPEENSDATA